MNGPVFFMANGIRSIFGSVGCVHWGWGGGISSQMRLCIPLVSLILYEVFLQEVDIFGRRVT